jgi:hypothetical protein
MQYIEWNPMTQSYTAAYTYYVVVEDPSQNGFYDGALNRVFPTPAVGQGFIVFNPTGTLSWGRTFSVN